MILSFFSVKLSQLSLFFSLWFVLSLALRNCIISQYLTCLIFCNKYKNARKTLGDTNIDGNCCYSCYTTIMKIILKRANHLMNNVRVSSKNNYCESTLVGTSLPTLAKNQIKDWHIKRYWICNACFCQRRKVYLL